MTEIGLTDDGGKSEEVEVQVVRPPLPVPNGLRRLDSLDEVATHPDGTVVVWHSWDGWDYSRQAGVLSTSDGGDREIEPISIGYVERNYELWEVTPPAWVLIFNDPPPETSEQRTTTGGDPSDGI